VTKIRVLVVEDSLTIRRRLCGALAQDPDCVVVGEADDGPRGVELCEKLRPDVVTLDLVLRSGTGVEVTEHIMAYCPTPIVIVSASFNRRDMIKTYDALNAGALEVIEKPTGELPDEAWSRRFVETVKLAARIKVITHPRGKLRKSSPWIEATPPKPRAAPSSKPPPQERVSALHAPSLLNRAFTAPAPSAPSAPSRRPTLVAIGASTGGPAAVTQLLRDLTPSFPLPVLLVIHIGMPFGTAFAEWLAGSVQIRVAEAKHGEPLPMPGQTRVVMAPAERHLVVRAGRLWLDDGPERHSCRPSVDVLFESVAEDVGGAAIGCLLTGMGKDGAAGLLAMKRAGSLTLVQDEDTSVVFGMPREAIRLGAAGRILPIQDFGKALLSFAHQNNFLREGFR